jgi:RNA recognition motif-containing protein
MSDNKKLYVGNLSWNTTDSSLEGAFAQAGAVVSAKIIVDRETNKSKGFGFVEMNSSEEAQKAIEMFNGKELDGRTIKVSEAKPQEAKPKRNFGSRW